MKAKPVIVARKADIADIIAKGKMGSSPRCTYVAIIFLINGWEFRGVWLGKDTRWRNKKKLFKGLLEKKELEEEVEKGDKKTKKEPSSIIFETLRGSEGSIPTGLLPVLMNLVEGMVMQGDEILAEYRWEGQPVYRLCWYRAGFREDSTFKKLAEQFKKEQGEKEEEEARKRKEMWMKKYSGVGDILDDEE